MTNKQQLLSHLHTFSVAAKYLSFTRAANDLFMTQAAVSQRIKKLESQLNFSLFIRKTRKLELTPEGERVLSTLSTSFDLIFNELDDIQKGELSGEIYVGTSPYIASAWIIPNLKSFRESYPHLSIKLITKQNEIDFEYDPIDLGIFYSNGVHPDQFCETLMKGKRVPICTPEYADSHNLFGNPQNLKNVNFLHSGGHSAWRRYLSQLNLNIDSSTRSDIFAHENTTSAALQSLGVALGRMEFDRHLLEEGKVVAPLPVIDSDKGYDVVCPLGMENRPKFQAFLKWLREIVTQ